MNQDIPTMSPLPECAKGNQVEDTWCHQKQACVRQQGWPRRCLLSALVSQASKAKDGTGSFIGNRSCRAALGSAVGCMPSSGMSGVYSSIVCIKIFMNRNPMCHIFGYIAAIKTTPWWLLIKHLQCWMLRCTAGWAEPCKEELLACEVMQAYASFLRCHQRSCAKIAGVQLTRLQTSMP